MNLVRRAPEGPEGTSELRDVGPGCGGRGRRQGQGTYRHARLEAAAGPAGPGRKTSRRAEPATRLHWCEGRRRVRGARAGLEIDHSEPQAHVWRSCGQAAAHRHTQRPGRNTPATRRPEIRRRPEHQRRHKQRCNTSGHTQQSRPAPQGPGGSPSIRGSSKNHDNVGITEAAFLAHVRDAELRGDVLGGAFHPGILVEDGRGLSGPAVGVRGAGPRISGLV